MMNLPFSFHFLAFIIRNLLVVEGDDGIRMNLRKAATVWHVFMEGEREGLGADMRLGLNDAKEAFEATGSEWREEHRQALIDVCALASDKYLGKYESSEHTSWKRFMGLLLFRCQDHFIAVLDRDPVRDPLGCQSALEDLQAEMDLHGGYFDPNKYNLILSMARQIDRERV